MARLISSKRNCQRYAQIEHAKDDLVHSFAIVPPAGPANTVFSIGLTGPERHFTLQCTEEETKRIQKNTSDALKSWAILRNETLIRQLSSDQVKSLKMCLKEFIGETLCQFVNEPVEFNNDAVDSVTHPKSFQLLKELLELDP